jgi:hypothetical protein
VFLDRSGLPISDFWLPERSFLPVIDCQIQ